MGPALVLINMIQPTDFTNPLTTLLAEIFGVSGTPHGYVLDDGKSGVIPTLDSVTAEQASKALSPDHATIASHTAHLLLLLHLFHQSAIGQEPEPDWREAWKHRIVDDAAWDTLRGQVRAAYDTVQADIPQNPMWNEDAVGGGLSLLAHVSYHFGEIRQMRTTLEVRG